MTRWWRWIGVAVCCWPAAASAGTRTAASLALADGQAAVDAAVGGHTGHLPAGTSPDWLGMLTIDGKKNIQLIGAGMEDGGTTIVIATPSGNQTGRAIYYVTTNSDTTARLSGFHLHLKTPADTPGVIRIA